MGPPAAVAGAARVAVPRRRRGHPAHRQGVRRRRHAGDQLRPRAGRRRRLGEFDLVLCGRQAIDGDTAQVGPQTAEKLGVPQITCVSRIDEVVAGAATDAAGAARSIVATRSVEGGFETLREPAAGAAHRHRRGQRPAPAERQARDDLQGHRRRGAARVRRQLPRPESDEAEVCMLDRDGRPVCRAKVVQWDARGDRRRARARRPARLAHARQEDRERRAARRARRAWSSPTERGHRRRSSTSSSRSTSLAEAAAAERRAAHAASVWVFVEQRDGVAAEVSLELLGRARELADQLGVQGRRRAGRGGRGRQGPRARPHRPRRRHRLRRRPRRPAQTTSPCPTRPRRRRGSCAATSRRSSSTAPRRPAATWRRASPARCAPA